MRFGLVVDRKVLSDFIQNRPYVTTTSICPMPIGNIRFSAIRLAGLISAIKVASEADFQDMGKNASNCVQDRDWCEELEMVQLQSFAVFWESV